MTCKRYGSMQNISKSYGTTNSPSVKKNNLTWFLDTGLLLSSKSSRKVFYFYQLLTHDHQTWAQSCGKRLSGNVGFVLWLVMIVMQSGSAVRVLCSEKIYTANPFYSIPIPQNCRVVALRAASNTSNPLLEVKRHNFVFDACFFRRTMKRT